MNWKKKSSNYNRIIIYILVFFSISSCNKVSHDNDQFSALPYYSEATFTPHWLSPESVELGNFHKIPAFQLINQEGDTITEQSFQNKIYVTDFFFTSCPGICPKMTANLSVLQDEFMDDDKILFLSHSVTPTRDSVPILKAYAEANGVQNGKWHLVTGKQEEIYTLGRKAYFVEEDLGLEKEVDEFLHTENFVLVDQNRHIRGIYNGLNTTSINQLIKDIKTLEKENTTL